MSIIYDALQKTQNYRDQDTDDYQELMTHDDWIDTSLSLSIALLLGLLIIAYYPYKPLIKISASNTVIEQAVQVTPAQSQSEAITVKTTSPSIKPILSPIPAKLSFDVAHYQSKHVLTGVFISQEQKVALIDNQFYNVGDMVDGLELIAIEHERVKLKNKHIAVELRLKV